MSLPQVLATNRAPTLPEPANNLRPSFKTQGKNKRKEKRKEKEKRKKKERRKIKKKKKRINKGKDGIRDSVAYRGLGDVYKGKAFNGP